MTRRQGKRLRGIVLLTAGGASFLACLVLLALFFLSSSGEKERSIPATVHVELGTGRHTVFELVARYNGQQPPFSIQELGVEPLVPADVSVTAPDGEPVAVGQDLSGRIEHGSNGSHRVFAAMLGFRAPVKGRYTVAFRNVRGKVVIGRPAARQVATMFVAFGLGALGLVAVVFGVFQFAPDFDDDSDNADDGDTQRNRPAPLDPHRLP